MPRVTPYLLTFTGALTLGLALASVHPVVGAQSPRPAPAPAAAAPITMTRLQSDLGALATKVDHMRQDIEDLKDQVRMIRGAVNPTQVGGGGGAKLERTVKEIKEKLEKLTQEYENHTHEYMIEAVGADGGTIAVPPGQIMGTGAQPTGRVILGKPIQK